ncbi:MAG TPA: serine/threonine-protein kinase, partial [Kofleriaceae bacterium]
GEYFFAMEYVHGEDARTLLVEASKRGDQIALEHVVTIIMGAAAGLHHAHEQRGIDGSPLHIVHRDVSPANILVGYDGSVKVADFGIALAAHRAEQTQSGVLKGKVAYMSPEQCNCDPVDRRSDVFSLGIVLYELATVRPCFAGDNDFMTMSAIVGGKLDKPSSHRPDLPPALEAIILKALARKASDRYQTADELRIALEQFAASTGLRTSTSALADYMKHQFGAKVLPWQEEDDEPEMEVTGVAPSRERTPKPTVPLRPVQDDLDMPDDGEQVDDDLSIPVAAGPAEVRSPTMPLRSLDMRPPAQVIVGTPTSKRIDRRRLIAAARTRRMWLAGSALAVAIAALSLVLVSAGSGKATPRASISPTTHPHSAVPQPLERPTVAPAVEQPAIEAAPAAAPKKSSHRSKKDSAKDGSAKDGSAKDSTKAAPTKKWDPDALFPQ